MEEHWSSVNFFRNLFKVKESILHEIWNADTVFLLSGAVVNDAFSDYGLVRTNLSIVDNQSSVQ